jgi:hypothetical protein
MATTLFTIAQGEQYAVEIVLENGGVEITPYNSDDVKIKLGDYEKKYSAGELTYQNNAWNFPITQEMSLSWGSGKIDLQGQYKSSNNIYNTEIYKVQVDTSIIDDTW